MSAYAFNSMLQAQLELQRESFQTDPMTLTGEERLEFLRWNVLALQAELYEALDETGWKPWADADHVHGEQALKEMVDAWHFFMNILLTLGGSLNMDVNALCNKFEHQYWQKRGVNARRQEEGYDGIADKCPKCRRSLDDLVVQNDQGRAQCLCGYLFEKGV